MAKTSSPPAIVYIVDQDSAVRDSLGLLFSTAGLEFEEFESAESFFGGFDPDRPGCLVTEVDLPGLTGLDLLERLQARGVELPAVVLARHSNVGQAVRAMQSGAVDFIEKPFVDRVLLQRVLQVIGQEAGNPQAERSDSLR